MKIYLTRHGQDEDNAAGLLNGHRDKPLTNLGIEQTKNLVAELNVNDISFDKIITSPLQRCVQTANIIKGKSSTTEIIIDDLLVERDMGVMTGTKIAEIDKNYNGPVLQTDVVKYFLEPENGDTFPMMVVRARQFFDELVSLEGNILLISHGSFSKALVAEYYNWDYKMALKEFHFGNCELIELSESGPIKVFEQEQFNYEDMQIKARD